MSEINIGLGGVNDFDVFIDEPENIVKIIDKNPLPNKDAIISYFAGSSKYPQVPLETNSTNTTFGLYGYSGSNAGFITDFSFTTELTPAFSTMITVGAQANGSVVGANSTALSKLNRGLTDRYNNYMQNGSGSPPIPNSLKSLADIQANYNALNEKYNKTIVDYCSFLIELSNTGQDNYTMSDGSLTYIEPYTYFTDDVDAYKGVLKDILDIDNQLKNLNNQKLSTIDDSLTPGTGFIPFNLSITMEGLSGMQINQQFDIDTSYLPSNYPKNVEFLIKNIKHDIQNNKWYTKLESYCIAKGKFTEKTNPDPLIGIDIGGFIEATKFDPYASGTSYGSCGTPILGFIPSPERPQKGETVLINSIKKAANAVFTVGEGSSDCSKYTYNIATNFINAINSKSFENGLAISGKGNANSQSTRVYLQSLGYKIYKVGENLQRLGVASTSIENILQLTKFNIGDIAIYWASDGPADENQKKYGHIQIYTGGNIVAGANWTSDKKANFYSEFVYKTKNNNCWNLYILRAPV
jgi:hypothetical protein